MRSAQREWRGLADALGRPATWRDLAARVGLQLDELADYLRSGRLPDVRPNCA
jgi:uncharacterized protein YidB (DUF937 family)